MLTTTCSRWPRRPRQRGQRPAGVGRKSAVIKGERKKQSENRRPQDLVAHSPLFLYLPALPPPSRPPLLPLPEHLSRSPRPPTHTPQRKRPDGLFHPLPTRFPTLPNCLPRTRPARRSGPDHFFLFFNHAGLPPPGHPGPGALCDDWCVEWSMLRGVCGGSGGRVWRGTRAVRECRAKRAKPGRKSAGARRALPSTHPALPPPRRHRCPALPGPGMPRDAMLRSSHHQAWRVRGGVGWGCAARRALLLARPGRTSCVLARALGAWRGGGVVSGRHLPVSVVGPSGGPRFPGRPPGLISRAIKSPGGGTPGAEGGRQAGARLSEERERPSANIRRAPPPPPPPRPDPPRPPRGVVWGGLWCAPPGAACGLHTLAMRGLARRGSGRARGGAFPRAPPPPKTQRAKRESSAGWRPPGWR